MPRKPSAKSSVITRQMAAARGLSVRAKWMASATVKLEVISTTVLMVPAAMFRCRLASLKASGNSNRYTAYPVKSPAKSRISVARNSHIPRRMASFCRSSEEKWWPTIPSGSPRASSCDTNDSGGLVGAVVVRHLRDGGDHVEVVRGRRRGRHPLESLAAPGIGHGAAAVPERDGQVDEDDHEPEGEQRGAGGGGHVERLELLRVLVVAPRHPEVAEQELGNEGGIESEDDQRRRHQAPALVVGAPEHLREPVMEPGEEGHHRGAHHHEVEVGHDEVGVVPVDVQRSGRERDAGHAAEDEEEEEPADVREGRAEGDGAAVHGPHPVEDLDG